MKQNKCPMPSSAHCRPTGAGVRFAKGCRSRRRGAGINSWWEPPQWGGFLGAVGIRRDVLAARGSSASQAPHHLGYPDTLPSTPGWSLSSWVPAGSTRSPAPSGTLRAGTRPGCGAPPAPLPGSETLRDRAPCSPRGAALGAALQAASLYLSWASCLSRMGSVRPFPTLPTPPHPPRPVPSDQPQAGVWGVLSPPSSPPPWGAGTL